ncbi:SusD/RagB family nutrient-binding outer membrane lipoprotein [Filimonas effusa]|uniref:SusD/RagB family nutrient-binding outer membrane lipoprotein n=1 Tax=Filimonas effusa TaxID=2508721 RepID=A0A4Q1DDW2_9BACT|nr:SusD/RagB family nutrient-binding outer membrane lipoprotein [Filimonas effusa]RXK86769.1 SusD/RagB family nutrient-binding outer membrane lipoprotein [Filimonas effusa]
MRTNAMTQYRTLSKILLAGSLLLTSCSKGLEDDFIDPNGFTNPTIEGFYAEAQQAQGTFRYSYSDMSSAFNTLGPMLGTSGYSNDGVTNMYSWTFDPFENSFSRLRSIAEMQRRYDALAESEKAGYKAYMMTADVIKAYIFYQLTDVFNQVPYFEALKGKSDQFFPKYDTQQDIYHDILSRLKAISQELNGFTLGNSAPELYFSTNDILFKADFGKWRIFVNSLRLRLAIHLTNVEPELAKSTIREVLAEDIYAKDRASSILLIDQQQDMAEQTLIFKAIIDQRLYLIAPENMLKVMRRPGQPEDPRIKVIFQPDKYGAYSGIRTEGPYQQSYADSIDTKVVLSTYPSFYNRTTFEQNFGMPYQILTSSEVHLILAEAAVRWPALGLNAGDEYTMAIKQSIDLYYEINALNTRNFASKIAASQPAKPTQTQIDAFAEAKRNEFLAAGEAEKKGLIYDQKYVHFNILKPYELWTETRRLYKELGSRVMKKPSNTRFMERRPYPVSESDNNYDNFAKVVNENNYTSPVWFTGR